jgi:hypothetical protein
MRAPPVGAESIRSQPVINWGRGRLMPYESFGAFAAKFCELNGLKSRELRNFLNGYLGSEPWNGFGFREPALSKVARLLDEPLAIVRTLATGAWRLPACFGTFRLEHRAPPFERVRYCPECLGHGFHAGFHEPWWIQKCLLHAEPLNTRWVLDHAAGSAWDSYVETIRTLLLRESAAGALSLRHRPKVLKELGTGRFRSFRRWLRDAQTLSEQLAQSNVIAARGGDYGPWDVHLLLSRLFAHVPWPEVMADSTQALVAPAHAEIVGSVRQGGVISGAEFRLG